MSAKLSDRFVRSVLRPRDLLYLAFEFTNLMISSSTRTGPALVRKNPSRAAYISIFFPPQSIAEQVFKENEDSDPVLPPVGSIMAGSSRLVFRVPDDIKSIPYTLEGLLDWGSWWPSLSNNASWPLYGEERPQIPESGPGHLETAIEMPYRLMLSPERDGKWAHSNQEVTYDGWTELWHTRLEGKTVRAIWSPDYSKINPPRLNDKEEPFAMSLHQFYRHQIVRCSSDFMLPDGKPDVHIAFHNDPDPISVDKLMMTSLGGWLKSRGSWDKANTGLDLEEWIHVATQGRDHYSKVVSRGYLFPFGHKASKVVIIERKIRNVEEGDLNYPVAYLLKREYIIVREPEKSYHESDYTHAGREMPLKKVRISSLTTPDIDPPTNSDNDSDPKDCHWILDKNGKETDCHWIYVNGKPFLFNISAVDLMDRTVEFSTAMIFVQTPPGDEIREDWLVSVLNEYQKEANKGFRKCSLNGQRMAFARMGSDERGSTTLTVEKLFFLADILKGKTRDSGFLPKMDHAWVNFPGVENIVGKQSSKKLRLFGKYLDSGFSDSHNKAKIFGVLDDSSIPISFPPEKLGCLATPNMDMTAISENLGPVAGNPEDLARGELRDLFNPDASLLGGIKIWDILEKNGEITKQLPTLVSESKNGSTITRLSWCPGIIPFGPFVNKLNNMNAALEINVQMESRLSEEPICTTNSVLSNFSFSFVGVISVGFNKLEFKSEKGLKPKVIADISGVTFEGPLTFINALQDFLKGGLGSGPSLDISPSSITVGYTLELPTVTIGIFSLQNIALSSGLVLPLTNAPARFKFAFSERHHPFQITVSLFSGAGFFGLAMGLDGLEMIEASLEFGGNFSLNLGVASGGVYVMAGIYFQKKKLENGKDSTEIAGFVRCGGSLEVLGIISISLEFYLKLAYRFEDSKVWGEATLIVEVEVLFFSKSVSLTVEREFAGGSTRSKSKSIASSPEREERPFASESGLLFGDTTSYSDWKEYARAFA